MPAYEVNFDGLIGPTHNYAGLSRGNIASTSHKGLASNPRKAARQGLAKMKWLADLGVRQAIFPPHERPCMATLRAFGLTGSDAEVLRQAAKHAPDLLAACSSASNMWVANAATVAPCTDTEDGRVHFTPANLVSKFHRSIEPPQTTRTLRAIFRDEARFVVHDPLPGSEATGDEGAANHTRFAPIHATRGLHFFVYGHSAFRDELARPQRYPARQSLEASHAVARLQTLSDECVCFAQQNPEAIDAGVFHNDVIAVGNENVFLYHEKAYVNTGEVVEKLRRQYAELHPGADLITIKVPAERISLQDAVNSYLFNSQLVTAGADHMALIAPIDCQEVPSVNAFVQELVAEEFNPIREVRYFDLKQSMKNGGGPACLRLRVVLTKEEIETLPPGIFMNETLYAKLNAWIRKNYRDTLTSADLADPILLEESRRALDELTEILGVGSIYDFQRV